MFHMAWFCQYRVPLWHPDNDPWSGDVAHEWQDGSFLVDVARTLERAGFDFMMMEDSSKVPDIHGGSFEADLIHGRFAPKHDPLPLIPLMAAATRDIGFIATMSSTFYPPYILARSLSTLDHITHGRIGWNIVTSSGDRAAQNFNMDTLPEHDRRYDMADEFVDVVEKLWASWEPDALVADKATGVYVDHTKVHDINHRGEFFSVRGPLNTLPSPQQRPVICQAGASGRGKTFGARNAEVIISPANTVESMRAFREDIHRRMVDMGRDPSDVRVLFLIEPILGATEQEARELREARNHPTDYQLSEVLSIMSSHTEIDMAQFDLDAPLPEMTTNHHRAYMEAWYSRGAATLRDIAVATLQESIIDELVGTPAQVAEQMGRMMEEVGGDGFLISKSLSRQYIQRVTDGLMPELRARGLVRSGYDGATLRENLFSF